MRIRRRAGSTECGCAQPRGWSGRGAAVLFRFARFSARPLRMTCRVPGGRTVVGAGYPAGCFDVAGPCLSGEGARRHLPTGFRTKWRHPIPRSDSAFRFRVSIPHSDSAFRFCILHLFPRYAFASAFRLRGFREVHSGSGAGSLAGEEEGRFFRNPNVCRRTF